MNYIQMRTNQNDKGLNIYGCAPFLVFRLTIQLRGGAPPGVWGIRGEGLFIFRELGSTNNYFKGAGEQAYTFGDLRSTAKK